MINYPGISEAWHPSEQTTPNIMLLTIPLKRADLKLQFFPTIAPLGAPYDITLQELGTERLFLTDEVTEQN